MGLWSYFQLFDDTFQSLCLDDTLHVADDYATAFMIRSMADQPYSPPRWDHHLASLSLRIGGPPIFK